MNDEDIAAVCMAGGVNDKADIAAVIRGSENDLRRVKRAVWKLTKGGRE